MNSSSSDQPPDSLIDLHELPAAFLLDTKLTESEVHDFEVDLLGAGLSLTQNPGKASWVFTKFESPRRPVHELRCRGVSLEPVDKETFRKQLEGKNTSSDLESMPALELLSLLEASNTICIVNLNWLHHSMSRPDPLPLWSYLIGLGLLTGSGPLPDIDSLRSSPPLLDGSEVLPVHPVSQVVDIGILERAQPPEGSRNTVESKSASIFRRSLRRKRVSQSGREEKSHQTKVPALQRQSTSEFEEANQRYSHDLPQWVTEGKKYACERSTPLHCSNQAFVDLLGKIRHARKLMEDEVGVRAYSTSMASIAAVDRPLVSPSEVLALPGCSAKIAHLFREWQSTGSLKAADEVDEDEVLKIIDQFHKIWGVGPKTARSFYNKGWRDLDDIIEFGWGGLSLNQKIGVKFYDEFLEDVPRAEVEAIADVILRHARRIRDDGVEFCLVGGYRRGKEVCHDVDIILSHRELDSTHYLVLDVIHSLEAEGWITHTLQISTKSSDRDQQPHPIRSPNKIGTFSDTLDKALVVWRDINVSEPTNHNIHRRVDIIVAPWSFVGCAIAGWSGGTTYERDLRRYAKAKHGWRFDSSGVRDRTSGAIIQLEDNAATMDEAEQMVFKGMGLPLLSPSERCAD